MTIIRQDDLIESVADALQFISYYHPADFIRAVSAAMNGKSRRGQRRDGADPD